MYNLRNKIWSQFRFSCRHILLNWKIYPVVEDLSSGGRFIQWWKIYPVAEDLSSGGRFIQWCSLSSGQAVEECLELFMFRNFKIRPTLSKYLMKSIFPSEIIRYVQPNNLSMIVYSLYFNLETKLI